MQTTPTQGPTAADLARHLRELECERALARETALASVGAYMRDLTSEIAETRAAFVGAAVTEIASLRAALGAPLQG